MTTRPVEHRLANGLSVLLLPSHHAPVTTFWMWYGVGSRHERPGITGASHWVEHMLFKGTEKFPVGEIDRQIAREGGVSNAMTSMDWTCFFATLPSDRIDLALAIEADRMANAAFDSDEVENERTVVISEREGAENSPLFQLGEASQLAALEIHPYRYDVVGAKADLVAMTRADLYDHYRRYYHAGNATAVAVGDFHPEAMLAAIEAHFAGAGTGPAVPSVIVTEPPQTAQRRVAVTGTDETSYVSVSWRAPAAADPSFFAFQVLDTVLGGAKSMNAFGGAPPNRSSRLYRALVDTELATDVSSGLTATIDPFLYTITAIVRQGADPARVERAILDTVAAMSREPLVPEELEKAASQARAQFVYSSESVTSKGFWLGFAHIVADQAWRDGYLDSLSLVRAEDVLDVANSWLLPAGCTIGHYTQANEGDAQ